MDNTTDLQVPLAREVLLSAKLTDQGQTRGARVTQLMVPAPLAKALSNYSSQKSKRWRS